MCVPIFRKTGHWGAKFSNLSTEKCIKKEKCPSYLVFFVPWPEDETGWMKMDEDRAEMLADEVFEHLGEVFEVNFRVRVQIVFGPLLVNMVRYGSRITIAAVYRSIISFKVSILLCNFQSYLSHMLFPQFFVDKIVIIITILT